MEVKEIIDSFKNNSDEKFQTESVLEARNKKEEVTEALVVELEKIANNMKAYAEDQTNFLPLYALYLLAEFREKRAFPIIIRIIKSNQDDVDILLGNVITEGLASILASTFDGNLNCLYEVITNLDLDEYVRGAAFNSLEILCKNNIISQEKIIKMIDSMLSNELKADDSVVIADIVTFISRNQIYDRIDLVRSLYAQDRVDIQMIGDYDQFVDDLYGKIEYHDSRDMIEDIVKSLSWWACFKKDSRDAEIELDKKLREFIKKEKSKEQEDLKKLKKIGRNDPCPCRKWKEIQKVLFKQARNVCYYASRCVHTKGIRRISKRRIAQLL